MKLIFQGDLHLRSTPPVSRIDDYWAAQWRKMEFLFQSCKDNDAILLLGGDLYDHYRVTVRVINGLMLLMKKHCVECIAVAGQHDIPYHNMNYMSSPLFPLVSSGFVKLSYEPRLIQSCWVHSCSWERTPTEPVRGDFNILLGHISVFDKIPHYWKGEGYTPETLRKKYPGFDLYLCGDIHTPLVDDNVVVSGSMMRMGIDQIDYRPRCYLIDTDDLSIKPLYYPIEEEIFSVQEEGVGSWEELDNLVRTMKEAEVRKSSFEDDCRSLSKGEPGARRILEEVFDELS